MSACGNIGPVVRFFLIIGVVAAFGIGRAARSEQPADSPSNRSTSVGTPMNGNLLKGVVLPWKGTGYRMIEETRRRRARFGISELVLMIKKVAIQVASAYKGSILGVGRTAAQRGKRLLEGALRASGAQERVVDLSAFQQVESGSEGTAREGEDDVTERPARAGRPLLVAVRAGEATAEEGEEDEGPRKGTTTEVKGTSRGAAAGAQYGSPGRG